MAKLGERAGWSAVWSSSLTGWEKSAQFKLKMVSDVLFLSSLNKIGLSLTGEAGQALAYLYSEARLYKGASLAVLSQSATTRSTGNISVGVKKVGHSNTRGTVISRSNYLLHLVYIFNILWRLKVKRFKTPTVKKKLFVSVVHFNILWTYPYRILITNRGGNHYFCEDVSPGHGTDYVHYFTI